MDCALPDTQAAALIVDESGTIVIFSDPVQRLLGHAPQTLCGQSVEVLLPERLRLAHIGQRLRFTDQRGHRPMGTGLPLVALSPCGTEIPVDISLSPMQRGRLTLTVVILEPREPAAHRHSASRRARGDAAGVGDIECEHAQPLAARRQILPAACAAPRPRSDPEPTA